MYQQFRESSSDCRLEEEYRPQLGFDRDTFAEGKDDNKPHDRRCLRCGRNSRHQKPQRQRHRLGTGTAARQRQ